MSRTQGPERGYRRLLAWYPAWHRQVHGEEMIGVLLAAAGSGKRRPGLAETVDIIWAGLLIRLRPRTAALPSGGWRDALAVFSVVAPVALTCQFLARELARMTMSPIDVAAGAAYLGLGLVLPLVLLRLRRVAALVSLLATVLLALACAHNVYNGGNGEIFAFPLFAYAAETAALLGSPGPRRGVQLLTWRAWALTVVAAACVGVAWFAVTVATFWALRPNWLQSLDLPGVLVAGAVAVAGFAAIAACVAARSVLGRRVLLIFAVVLYVLLMSSASFLFSNLVASALLTYLPPLAAVGLALRAVSRSRRHGPDGQQPA